MDCPSEENLIRVKLQGVNNINHLDFDIGQRRLFVYHTGSANNIANRLQELNLGSRIISTTQKELPTDALAQSAQQRKLLWAVLAINAGFFGIESTAGWLAGSMGLLADSLDMLADAFVYAISLLAVGGTVAKKQNIARLAGYFQLVLALMGFLEVIRRTFFETETPHYGTMMVVSALALAGNAFCLYLLQKSKSKTEAHMQASMIFTSNDVIINIGVIVAGALVLWTQTPWPDLLVGTVVFVVVLQGAMRILKLARS